MLYWCQSIYGIVKGLNEFVSEVRAANFRRLAVLPALWSGHLFAASHRGATTATTADLCPSGIACPFCGYQGPPVFSKRKLSTGGWVLFAVLLVCCFPICWLPFVIDGCKEDEWMCPSCHIRRA